MPVPPPKFDSDQALYNTNNTVLSGKNVPITNTQIKGYPAAGSKQYLTLLCYKARV